MREQRLRIRQGDRELEIEGDRQFVLEQLDRLYALAFGASLPDEGPRVPATFAVRPNLAFDDFVRLKEPATDVDRLVVLAYYHEKYGGVGDYPLLELERWWTDAWSGLPFGAQVLEEAFERGFFQRLEDERLTLSFAGQKYVRDGLA